MPLRCGVFVPRSPHNSALQGPGDGLIHPELPASGARLRAECIAVRCVTRAPVGTVAASLLLLRSARPSVLDEPISIACSWSSGAAADPAADPLSASIRSIYLRSIHP